MVRIVRETHVHPGFLLSRPELSALVAMILETIERPEASLTIKLVDDREIARLNREFLGCTGPTNVLSFPAEDGGEPDDLGELALSVDTLVRETDLYGQTPVAHLTRLLTHGILHLAGLDHGDEMYDLTDHAVDRALLEYGEISLRVL